MDPQQTNSTRPGAGGRLGDSWEDGPSDTERSPADAFKDLGSHLGELKAYATYYLSAKADGIRVSVRNLGLYAVLGVVGLTAGGAAVVTATVLLLTGIAGAISAIFRSDFTPPDRTWIGEITVGILILGGVAIGAILFMKKLTAASRERTVKKYESRQQQQRIKYGHDVHERAESAR
ncbi:MAG TPA: DUF308 domain-containing protein [Tepidisphaeraceae bacterium]|nr:DUF308 domain-containing protein [Tepidisphaeraceae bacterium]